MRCCCVASILTTAVSPDYSNRDSTGPKGTAGRFRRFPATIRSVGVIAFRHESLGCSHKQTSDQEGWKDHSGTTGGRLRGKEQHELRECLTRLPEPAAAIPSTGKDRGEQKQLSLHRTCRNGRKGRRTLATNSHIRRRPISERPGANR